MEIDLRVCIDQDLNFDEQRKLKIEKANGMVGAMRRSFKFLDCYTFKKFLDRVFSVLMFSQSLFQVIKQSILTGL